MNNKNHTYKKVINTEAGITELDSVRFLEILKRDLATHESLSEDDADEYTRKKGKEEADILRKFLSAFNSGYSSPCEDLKKEIIELRYEQAKDRQRIAELELYLGNKNNGGRRDFDLLSVKLMKEVLRRRKGMDYKDVLNFFRFNANVEAFRLMRKTAKNFPNELKLYKPKVKGRQVIVRLQEGAYCLVFPLLLTYLSYFT